MTETDIRGPKLHKNRKEKTKSIHTAKNNQPVTYAS